MSLIEFDRVSKIYTHTGGAKLIRAHVRDRIQRKERSVFYALRNVSFRIEEGESVAIIGRNGAGKSTLLSLVAGLSKPSEGKVRVNSRVAALLELGSGFHPDLTGAENVSLNAALLGLTRARTNELYESILDFAGIGDFIGDPLRTYSSGMVMRLAFAVAIHVDAGILMIDEVLGVGDQRFQEKCFDKIMEYRRAGRSLLFVSHGAEVIRRLCDRAIWLSGGEVQLAGPAASVLEAYENSPVMAKA